MSPIDLDQLRKVLEEAMGDLARALPDAHDWRPTLIYMLEILDHEARRSEQRQEFEALLREVIVDVERRLASGGWL